jgi:hypothetical protein
MKLTEKLFFPQPIIFTWEGGEGTAISVRDENILVAVDGRLYCLPSSEGDYALADLPQVDLKQVRKKSVLTLFEGTPIEIELYCQGVHLSRSGLTGKMVCLVTSKNRPYRCRADVTPTLFKRVDYRGLTYRIIEDASRTPCVFYDRGKEVFFVKKWLEGKEFTYITKQGEHRGKIFKVGDWVVREISKETVYAIEIFSNIWRIRKDGVERNFIGDIEEVKVAIETGLLDPLL